jgi:RNA-binding protein
MTSKERAKLRAEAHSLTPVFQIGKSGLTDAVIKQTEEVLDAKELIKVKVLLESCPQRPREIADRIAESTGADVIGVIGGVIILYRYSEELHKKQAKKEANKKAAARISVKNQLSKGTNKRR